ncbi:uncharacterized protein LOC143909196 [Arctopsyche grandis]|uniref:uncharacterized protein LOC143909196 n=1 Tax=Arctopsyche grandis TaxID=121162 RepID=UPI00406D8809
MKYLIACAILSLCASTAVAAPAPDIIQWVGIHAARGWCSLETFVNQTEVLKVRSWDFSSEDPLLKKYVYCVYKRLNIVDDSGSIDVNSAVKILPKATDPIKFVHAVEACQSESGFDRYDKTYNILKCYNDKYPEDIIAL